MLPYLPNNPHLSQSKLRQIFEKAPAGSINLGLGQPGEDTPRFIREALAKASLDAPLGYTLNAGILPLREKLADELSAYGVQANQLCLTSGVQEALFALFYVLVSPETDILLPDPGFLTYPALAKLRGNTPRYYTLSATSNFRFDAAAVIEAIRPETSMILVAHPSNPAGSDASRDELQKLIHYCQNRKEGPIWIVADEVYYGMSYNKDSCSLETWFSEYPYIILLRGASKSHHLTGSRLGWAILPHSIAPKYVAAHQYICTCANASVQHAFLRIRGTDEEKAWLSYQNELYRTKRDVVHSYLSGLRTLYGGESAFYWLMEMNTEDKQRFESDEAMVMKLLHEDHLVTVPGSAFGEGSKDMIRISYGPEMTVLKQGLEKLVRILSA